MTTHVGAFSAGEARLPRPLAARLRGPLHPPLISFCAYIMPHPLVVPFFAAGKEPLPPGYTEEDRTNLMQAQKYQTMMQYGMESCVAKTAIAGIGGT